MQAMPTIQVDPTSAAVPAEAQSTAAPVSDGQFSQHLETAGRNIAPTSGKGKTGHPVPAEDMGSTAVSDQENDIGEDLADLIAGDSQLVMATGQNQPIELPTFMSKGLSTTVSPEGTQQNAQILTLLDSIQIQGTSIQGQNNEKPAVTLASLLEKTISSGNEKQLPVDSSTATAGVKVSSEPAAPAITIENWQAQFSYQSRTNVQALNTKPVPGQEANMKEGGFREPVLAYVSPEVEKIAAPTQAKHGSGIDFPSQPRDANSNYIHSNLPGVNVKAESESSNKNAQQQNGEGQKNMAKDAISQAEQAAAAKSSQDTPLIFSLDQERTSGLMPQGQTNSTSLMLKLPSGTEVPQSQVMNQVIDRFTLNRTLESGNITLKLYPEELGELRMEIKVEQDNIKAHITTQNPQVQEILDRHLPRLREALEQQGLNLEQMKVTVAADDDSSGQLFQEHFDSQQPKRSQRSNTDQLTFSLDQDTQDEGEDAERQQNLSVLA